MNKILITGGTGTIGTMLAKNFLEKKFKVVIFSRDEFKQSEMQKELPDCEYILGDVRSYDSIKSAIEDTNADYVIHAAALKQVVAGEDNPLEVINTNILGTANVLKAAQFQKTIVISSDKACYPVNLYGATKMVAEKLAFKYHKKNYGNVRVVRYGNVAGSRGSVIPAFRELIDKGMPISITDARMTRFWITQKEAVELIENSLFNTTNFLNVPRIPSFHIMDLVYALGYRNKECIFTGVRPGEKLHETLLTREENNGEEYRSDNNPNFLSVSDLKKLLKEVK